MVARLHEITDDRISIIVPVLDDAPALEVLLGDLQSYRSRGHEVIVVDGGSRDKSFALAEKSADCVQQVPAGRALQMNAGAAIASFDWLWFLHADSRCGAGLDDDICQVSRDENKYWGRFEVEFESPDKKFRMIAAAMNFRSCLTGIATGDQGIFVRKSVFEQCGFYPSIPLMEDIALCTKLRKKSRPLCLKSKVKTSSRRWQTNGVVRTILLMWFLRFGFFVGISPEILHGWYYRK